MPTPLLRPATARPAFRRSLGLLGGAALLSLAAHTADAQVVFGLSGSDLTSVNLASPFTSQTRVAITGVTAGQTLVGLDFRPATGELYALGYNSALTTANAQLYVINQTTAVATPVGAVMALALGGSTERIGFDFNPTVDRIRVVSTNDANYRLHPTTGAVTIDGAIAFAAGDVNAGQNPYVGAAAYTNSFIGAASTTLYTVDEQRSLLLIQNPPNNGTQNTVVPLNPQAGGNATPINAPGASTDLDIINFGVNNGAIDQQAYLNVNQVQGGQFVSLLYRLNLATGATTLAGAINGNGVGITDIAIRIDRTAPAASGQLLYALNTNNTLLSFYSGTPQYINSAVSLTGVTAGQTIVGTDFRPNTGQLFGFGYDATTAGANSQLYTIDVTSGVATAVGPAIRLELGGSTANIGFDFNPTVDRIRVTSSNRANLRLNPNNGALAATDGSLAYAAGDTTTARIGSVGYTNSYPGSTSTTLYDLDDARNVLATQNPPNAGTLNVVGSTGLGVSQTAALVDLDIYYDRSSNVNRAFLTANPSGSNFNNLYTLDLASGSPTLVGAIGLGITVRDIAAQLAGADASAALTGRLLYGVAGGNLVSFDSGNPTVIRTAVNITGLPADGSQVLVGTDFSPATGELFALGYNATTQQGQLYTLNLTTGALAAVGSLNAYNLGTAAANIGFDFNPTVNLIRVVSGTNQANLRVNPTTGAVTVDTPLSNPSGAPVMTGAAYTNNDNNAGTGTTLFGIDQARSVLLRSTNANGGTYVDQGALNVPLNAALGADFDIYSDLSAPATPANSAFLAAAPTGSSIDNLYSVDLASGAASSLGRIGSGSNLTGLAAFLTPGPVIAAGLTWTGAVSTDWGTAGNWSPAQVPTATDNVTIPDVANDPVVSNAQQANGVTLASGATLTTADGGTLTVNGTFTNNGGTTLGSGTGTIAFNGAAAQTISGTTTFFNNLTAGPAGVTASAPVQVQRVLLLNGNLASGGNLTLLSNATGTAHVVNNGGVVSGNATVQRYVDASLNPGAGYRHFSAPVSNTTLADLATGSYSPVVNPAYNTAPVPNNVTPFPTVFGYDETRVTASGNPAPQDFDRGFFSPNATTDPMTVGRGYTVNIPAGQTPDFVGTLNNGTINIGGLTRGNQTESGWQLLGNPYPSPVNWDLVSRSNVDAAVYVYRSTGQYAGTYSTYVANGVGINGGTNVIGTGQGFFVRVSTPGTSNGQVAFANAARFTTYQSPVFQRTAAVSGPLVRLALQGASGPADETVVYLEPGATVGFDAALDAYKLLAGGAPLLASPLDAATRLSVNALPPLSAAAPERVIPLHVQGLQAGAHTLRAAELLNLPAGTYAYLRDADTGALVDLQAQPSYSFTLANTALTSRFSLVLTQNRVLATASAALSQQIGLYPNPARSQVTLQLPAALAQQPVAVSVLNALGQQVLTRALPAGRSADALTLPLTGLAKGVYTVRLTTPAGLVAKRLVVE